MHYDIEKCGERIRQLRKQKGYTQEALAGELNMDRSVLSRIEVGKYSCSIDFLAQISVLFGASLDYLVFGKVHIQDTEGRLFPLPSLVIGGPAKVIKRLSILLIFCSLAQIHSPDQLSKRQHC